MKTPKFAIGIVVIAIFVAGIAIVAWPRTPRGEHQTERGTIYYFSDGVIGVDSTRQPHEFHIYAAHPENKKIEKAELIADGIQITGPGVAEGAEDFLGAAEVSVGYSGPVEAGKVRVVLDRGDLTESLQMAIDPGTIQEFIDRGDWSASVRELWEK